jgi:hypothetical protein
LTARRRSHRSRPKYGRRRRQRRHAQLPERP